MGITRLSDATTMGMNAGRFDVTRISSSNLIVTPAITAARSLKLIAWKLDSSGALSRLSDSGDLGAGAVITDVASPSDSASQALCTAFRRTSGELGLMVWGVNTTNGTFEIATSGVAGAPVSFLDVEAPANTLVSIWRNRFGYLRLQSNRLTALGRVGLAEGEAVSALGHPVLATANDFVTPVMLECGSALKLISWRVAKDGSLVRRGDSGDKGRAATRVALAQIGGVWATAARVGNDDLSKTTSIGPVLNGMLRVTFWRHETSGAFTRLGEKVAMVPVSDVDAAGLDYSDMSFGASKARYRIVTAARTSSNRLRLMVWSWLPDDSRVTLDSDSGDQPEPISLLRLISLGTSRFVTVVRDETLNKDKVPPRRLKLTSWSIQ